MRVQGKVAVVTGGGRGMDGQEPWPVHKEGQMWW
jgi:hypothetical protein